jgi:hypothetical protein
MSDLENVSKPVIAPLIHGVPAVLDLREQMTIATWFFKNCHDI